LLDTGIANRRVPIIAASALFDYNAAVEKSAANPGPDRIDLLEQALAEQTARRLDADERFRSIFENAPIALFTYDRQGAVLRWNRALVDLLGTPAEGATFQTVIREDPRQRMIGITEAVFEGRGVTDIHWETEIDDGDRRYLSISTFPVRTVSGSVAFGVAIVLDVSEKKHLEQALLQTEKMAALGTLASGLAHEVGTPMNVILGRAESLLKHTQEERTARGLQIIIAQIDRMTRLIQQLLTFARRKPLERRMVEINAVVEEGIALVEEPARPFTLRFEKDPSLPAIRCDGDQMLQVLFNLLMNAIDSLQAGGVIEVATRKVEAERRSVARLGSRVGSHKPMLEITIADTGCGIDPGHLHRIFDPFFTTKPVGKGTGLGLSVAQSIVRDHDGQIHATSAIGRGTTFRILLPLESAESAGAPEGGENAVEPP